MLAPRPSASRKVALKLLEHSRLDDPVEARQFLRDPEPDAGEVLGRGRSISPGRTKRSRVAPIAPDHVPEQESRIGHVAGQRPCLSREEANAIMP